MKMILLPLENGDGQQAMLETAWLAATAFGSTIQGLYIRRALSGVAVADIGGAAAAPDLVESFEAEDRKRGASARRAFEEFLRGKGVALGEAPPGTGPAGEDRPSATWAEEIPPGDIAVGMYARLFDLTVVGRPVQGASTPGGEHAGDRAVR